MKKNLLTFSLLALLQTISSGQGWHKYFTLGITDITETKDGGYLATGYDYWDTTLLKLDSRGEILKTKTLKNYRGFGWGITQIPSGGFVNGSSADNHILYQLDEQLNVLKSLNLVNNIEYYNPQDIDITKNGNIYFTQSTSLTVTHRFEKVAFIKQYKRIFDVVEKDGNLELYVESTLGKDRKSVV